VAHVEGNSLGVARVWIALRLAAAGWVKGHGRFFHSCSSPFSSEWAAAGAARAAVHVGQGKDALQLNSNTCERAYEAYVLSLCAEAVRSAGGTATLTGINTGPNPALVVLRGGPGDMASRGQDFCYVDCVLSRKRFEIHADVVYEGQSGANHEIDVSICEAAHAQDVRQSGRAPRTNKYLIAAIECKFYQSSPGVALARTFVGLIKDCSPNRLNAFVSNQTSRGLDSFLSTTWAPKPFTDLTALNPQSERRFIANVEQVLRQWERSR